MHLRNNKIRYDYLCTHANNFKVTAKDPDYWVERISSVFLLKTAEEQDDSNGLNYKHGTKLSYPCPIYMQECAPTIWLQWSKHAVCIASLHS